MVAGGEDETPRGKGGSKKAYTGPEKLRAQTQKVGKMERESPLSVNGSRSCHEAPAKSGRGLG